MKKIQIVFLLFLSIQNNYGQIIEKNWENCSKYLGNVSRDLSSYNITTTQKTGFHIFNHFIKCWKGVLLRRNVMS